MAEQPEPQNENIDSNKKQVKNKITTDQWLKLAGLLLALVGTIITIMKFTGTEEPPLKLSEEQKEIYLEVSDIIGELIAQNDKIDNETASEFYKLYNGRMILVEDSIVSRATRRFKFELDDKRSGIKNVLNPNKFKKTGIEVIEACRDALNN
tara:strand:- start:25343 stop:25798 length:456 start_codon:yes stop_codon:yes gene_type:complete